MCFWKTKSIHNCFGWNYITMQILLQVVLSFENYQVWWLQNIYFILQKTLHELHFCDNPFFFFLPKQFKNIKT